MPSHDTADALENDESYVAAMKSLTDADRAQAAAADDEAHREKLKREAEEEAAREAAAEAAAAAKRATGGTAANEDDGEVHMQVKLLKKGDEETFAQDGDKVALTYTGSFAEGVTYEGTEYGGKQFDSTLQPAGKNKKAHKPLAFKLGEGKAIRGWEECVRKMSLGEKVEVTIGPKWAYRSALSGSTNPTDVRTCGHTATANAPFALVQRLSACAPRCASGPTHAPAEGGLQDDNGKYIVPPNATLFFEMRARGTCTPFASEPRGPEQAKALPSRPSCTRRKRMQFPVQRCLLFVACT